jgi:hypothetical protein
MPHAISLITLGSDTSMSNVADLTLEEQQELELLYDHLSKPENTGQRAHIKFTSEGELKAWSASARKYLRNRPQGALDIRFSRGRGVKLPPNEIRCNIIPWVQVTNGS